MNENVKNELLTEKKETAMTENMLMSLQQAKENPLMCNELQLKNWLNQLDEYFKRDTEMKVIKQALNGRYACPSCGGLMAINVKEFCDICGQKIALK